MQARRTTNGEAASSFTWKSYITLNIALRDRRRITGRDGLSPNLRALNNRLQDDCAFGEIILTGLLSLVRAKLVNSRGPSVAGTDCIARGVRSRRGIDFASGRARARSVEGDRP